mgnify:CR=1 FL=1
MDDVSETVLLGNSGEGGGGKGGDTDNSGQVDPTTKVVKFNGDSES